MKSTLMIATAMLAALASAKTSTPAGWTDDYEAALKQAAAEKKAVLVDFSGSDWCGWCKRLDKEVFDTEAFRKGATKNFVLLMVDSPRDKELLSEKAKKQNPDLVKKYDIHGFPTVLALDAKGEVLFQTGYKSGGPEKYLKMLEEELKFGPDIQKYIKPIEKVLDEHDDAFQKAMRDIGKTLEKKFPKPEGEESKEARQKRMKEMRAEGQRIMFTEVAPKYIPLFEASFAKAKKMSVPDHLKAKKDELIASQERNFKYLKDAKAKFDKGEPKEGK